MRIDPKDLIPINLNDFRVDGHMYLLVKEGDYTRVSFTQKEMDDNHARALIWNWMLENEKKLFLNRNRPWAAMTR